MIVLARDLLDVLFATLWQGALIAAVSSLLLRVAGPRVNAATRAAVLQITLFAMLAVPVSTTLWAVREESTQIGGYGVVDRHAAARATSSGGSRAASRRIDVALDDRTVLAIAYVWFFGTCCFATRIVAGELQLRRILRESQRVDDRDGARIYVSQNVGVPFATGFRSAAIVIPKSLTRSETQELDAVLLHELAHVTRRDVWSNACERIVQAALFFNPAAHIVVRAIAVEREAACDDWAAARSYDLETYVRALATFALGYSARARTLSATLGFGQTTISRLRRLEDTRRNGATTLSTVILRASMLSLVSIALALQVFAPAIAFAPVPNTVQLSTSTTKCDTRSQYIGGPPPTPADLPKGDYMTHILVTLSATGSVTGASLKKSSGNSKFDKVAEAIALKSRFSPQRRNCISVAGSYVFQMRQQMNTGK